MVCGSVTDIYLLICDSCAHMSMTIRIKLHTLGGICEYNCGSSNNYNLISTFFFKVPQR